MNNVRFRFGCNVALHSAYQKSFINEQIVNDKHNLDSIASEIYFENFLSQLRKQNYFDTLFVLAEGNYSNLVIKDTLNYKLKGDLDSLFAIEEKRGEIGTKLLSTTIKKYPNKTIHFNDTTFLNKEFGLYKKEDLEAIRDSTNADLLLSLDFFSSVDGINYYEPASYANETVGVTGLWNFFELDEPKLKYFYKKEDTITWEAPIFYKSELKESLPSTKDAVLNAADIAGSGFANFLVPHWSKVQRMYYYSMHVELKQKACEL